MTPQSLPHFSLHRGFGSCATPCPGAQRSAFAGPVHLAEVSQMTGGGGSPRDTPSRGGKGEGHAEPGPAVSPPSAGGRMAWRSWLCLSGTLLIASVPGGAWQRGAGCPPATACPPSHRLLSPSFPQRQPDHWEQGVLGVCNHASSQRLLWFSPAAEASAAGAGRHCGTAGDTVPFGRVSGLCCLSSHARSAFLFHFKPTIFGRKAGLLPQTEPRMYWIRPTGRLIWESSSTSGQARVLPKNALSLPGVVQRYPMESAGKTVT